MGRPDELKATASGTKSTLHSDELRVCRAWRFSYQEETSIAQDRNVQWDTILDNIREESELELSHFTVDSNSKPETRLPS